MSHQLTKLFLLTFLLLTLPQTANAYWLENEPEPFSLREREHAPPTEGKMFFTIQDNFELFTDKIDPGPMLLPHSDYFVPADVIDINIPLFGIFSHPAKQIEDPIANLLYANLKIKKLLDEYVEIQKRAAELLGDEPINSPEDKMHINGIKLVNFPNGKERKDSPIYLKLQHQLIILSTTNQSEFNARDAEQKNNSQTPPTWSSLLSLQPAQKKKEIPLQTSKPNTYNPPKTGKIISEENQYQTTSKDTTQTTPTNKQEQNNQYTGEITLPRLQELPNKIFNYLISHKIQAFFIAFGLLIINVIFGSRH